jgi:hypothetical protein
MLSLEAPIIAVAWQGALARVHEVRLPPEYVWGLALLAWVVYALDRVADAGCAVAAGKPLSLRHGFHHRHRRLILAALVPLAVVALLWAALWRLPETMMWHGIALSMLTLLYLACFAAAPWSGLRWVLMTGAVVLGVLYVWNMPQWGLDTVAFGGRDGGAVMNPGDEPSATAWWARVLLCLGLMLAGLGAAMTRPGQEPGWLLPRECLAALLFVLGCSAGAHHWSFEHSYVSPLSGMLAGVVLMNLVVIACAEGREGIAAGSSSLRSWRPQLDDDVSSLGLITVVLATVVIFQVIDSEARSGPAVLAAASLVSAQLLVALNSATVRARAWSADAVRALADAAVLVPVMAAWPWLR